MAAYVIVDVEVLQPEPYGEYVAAVPGTLEPFGGRFLARGGRATSLEGDWRPARGVIIEFPSAEQARGWYESAAYQAILPLRHRHGRTNFMTVIEGV